MIKLTNAYHVKSYFGFTLLLIIYFVRLSREDVPAKNQVKPSIERKSRLSINVDED